jgi:hypothetical protein
MQPVMDIGAFMATMLQAQTENQLDIAAVSHTNMVAFHMATAQAIAAKAGDKDSRMTTLKRHILQACTGHGDATSFTTPPVYLEMETEGATSEALARILCRQLKPVPLTLHKTNIYVTPHLVLTIKKTQFLLKWQQDARRVHKRDHHLRGPLAICGGNK